MPDPNKTQPPVPTRSYKALQSFDLATGRHVNAGDTFEASDEEVAALVKGTDYEDAQPRK